MSTPDVICYHCLGRFPAPRIARHQAGCIGPGDHLRLAFRQPGQPWALHLTVAPGATLADVDRVLRETWLECCGHLSSFFIGKQEFSRVVMADGWGPPAHSMDVPVADVLRPGDRLRHIYDWGSTTELEGRALPPVAAGTGDAVEPIARNVPPVWRCGCGAPAVTLCGCCQEGMGCGCRPGCPECGEPFAEMGLPVVDSPRMGVCGYAG